MVVTHVLLALIYIQNSITMTHLAVLQMMLVIKWPQTDSDGSCVNKNVRGNKGFYSRMHEKDLSKITKITKTRIFGHLIFKGDNNRLR